MRWLAAVFALSVAVLELVLFAVAQAQLQRSIVGVFPTVEAPWLRWVWAVAWAVPWLVGAVLLVFDRAWRGVAVVLTAGLLLLATGLASITDTGEPRLGDAAGVAAGLTAYGGMVLWLLALGASVAAFLARPREHWRVEAPGPIGPYVTVAILAWFPAAFQTTAFAPPGAPRAFYETEASALSGGAEVASIATAVTVALVLFAACRLRPEVGGLVLLAYAVPALFAEIGSILQVRTQEFVIFTPAGVLGLIGLVGLVAFGVRWASRSIEVVGTVRG